MSEQRKKYTSAEKAKIALEAIKGEQTLAQISSKYRIHATQISSWKKQLLSRLPDVFNDKVKQEKIAHNDEISKLYEQIGRLKVENDFLKKSLRCYVLHSRDLRWNSINMASGLTK